MKKAPDAFRTISEVADWLDVQPHVLRFWESKFTQVKPVKRAGGRRYYRPADMQLIGGIKKLLHDEGMTIKGVQKTLREKGVEHVSSLSKELDMAPDGEGDVIDAVAVAAPVEPVEVATASEAGDVAETEEAPNVVTFQSRKSRPKLIDPDQSELASTGEPEAAPEAEPEPEAAATPDPEPVEAKEPEAEPEPEAEDDADTGVAAARAEPDLFEEEEEQPDLPSFLHRSARPAPEPEPEAAPEPEVAEDPGPPKPRIVEAPDPPAESEIAANTGVLGQLAALKRLPPASVDMLAPIAAELRALLGQDAGAGPT